MTKHAQIALALSTALTLATPAGAQERLGTTEPSVNYGAGWTFTPIFGVAETYDDNISLFGRGTAEGQNDDYVATYFPGADLHRSGKHSSLDVGYTGSFLQYQTFSVLNRWDQRGRLQLRRQETARLKWFAHGNAASMPSTDAIDLGGIPFRHTGATTLDGRVGADYALNARDGITTSLNYQRVNFDRPEEVSLFLRGGRALEAVTGWRHKMDARLSLGADYSFRRASVTGDLESFNLHSIETAADYQLGPAWSFSGAAGVVYLQSTPTTLARTGPAWRIGLERRRELTSFHLRYLRSYIPSFAFGGTIQNQEIGVGYRTPLFGNRRLYLDNSLVFRDDTPLTEGFEQLPLRSLRTYTTLGWEPEPWVRIEGFYARTQQTSLRAGGQVYRNRIGIQIVTSKPMRVQ